MLALFHFVALSRLVKAAVRLSEQDWQCTLLRASWSNAAQSLFAHSCEQHLATRRELQLFTCLRCVLDAMSPQRRDKKAPCSSCLPNEDRHTGIPTSYNPLSAERRKWFSAAERKITKTLERPQTLLSRETAMFSRPPARERIKSLVPERKPTPATEEASSQQVHETVSPWNFRETLPLAHPQVLHHFGSSGPSNSYTMLPDRNQTLARASDMWQQTSCLLSVVLSDFSLLTPRDHPGPHAQMQRCSAQPFVGRWALEDMEFPNWLPLEVQWFWGLGLGELALLKTT